MFLDPLAEAREALIAMNSECQDESSNESGVSVGVIRRGRRLIG